MEQSQAEQDKMLMPPPPPRRPQAHLLLKPGEEGPPKQVSSQLEVLHEGLGYNWGKASKVTYHEVK